MSAAAPARLRIDVATGEVGLDAVDAVVPGPIPLVLRRAYRSLRTEPGPFGRGWTGPFDIALAIDTETVRCVGGAFDGALFAAVAPGRAARLDSGLVLEHHVHAFALWTSPRRRFVFDKRGGAEGRLPLSAIRDSGGGALTLDRRDGLVVRVDGPPGGPVRFTYGAAGAEAAVQGRSGRVLARWDVRDGALRSAAGTGRPTEHYAYDGERLVEHRAAGTTTFAQYDADGRALALWGPGRAGIRVGYDARRHTTRVLEGDGSQTLYRYTPERQVLEKVHPDATARVYYYGLGGALAGDGDADGARAFQAFDPAEGRLLIVDHDLRAVAVDYDADGRAVSAGPLDADAAPHLLSWSDAHTLAALQTPAGHTWRFERDATGRVITVASPAGRTVRVAWSAGGMAVEDADGRRREETWDEAGRVLTVVDRSGRRERRRYGDDGHLTAVEIGERYRAEAFRDDAGRITAVADSEGERVKVDRDAAGRVIGVAGPGDRRVAVRRDDRGRIVRAERSDGAAVQLAYAADGRLASVDGPRGTATYTSTEGGTVVAEATGSRHYNRAGDLVARVAGDERTLFDYGISGELRSWGGALGTASLGSVHLGYDADGRLDRVAGRPPLPDAAPVDLRLAHDADGLLAAVHLADRPALTVETDATGRPVAIGGALAARLRFDAADRLVEVEAGGASVQIAYDALDRPTHVRDASGSVDLTSAATEVWDRQIAEAEGPDAAPLALRLRVERRGVLVSAHIASVPLVLWARDEVRCPAVGMTTRRVAAVVHGEAAALGRRPADPDALLGAWTPDPDRDLRVDHTAVPRAADLGLPWALLDAYVLDPAYLDALPSPLDAPRHQGDPARDALDDVAGTHTRDPLRAMPWRRDRLAVLAPPTDLLALDGPPSLGDVLTFLGT